MIKTSALLAEVKRIQAIMVEFSGVVAGKAPA